MKKLAFLLISILSLSMLFSCELLLGCEECQYGEWHVVTEATCVSDGERIRYCDVCKRPEREKIDKLPHTEKAVAGRASTCELAGVSAGVVCSVCDAVISGCTELSLAPHTPSVIPGRASTCTSMGLSDGEICSVCNEVTRQSEPLPLAPHTEEIIPATDKRTEGKKCSVCDAVLLKPTYIIASDFDTPEKYDGDYGLSYLATLDKADSYTAFYQRMDEACDDFHTLETDADAEYIIAKLDFSDLGMTKDEAQMVWCCYRNDRPLYYWMSGMIKYTSEQLWLMVDEEYVSEAVRLEINNSVYDKVADFTDVISGADTHYDITLALHDEIILSADYAYESDGTTPDDSAPSHNIVGTLLLGRGVCESYARVFQLLLNYFEIDNIFVTGHSKGVPHAWNMVKMDDGEYYWFDLTWDDQPTHMWGVTHNYFCVSSADNVNWQDGVYDDTVFDAEGFLDNHTVDGQEMGVNFLYSLPTPAADAFTDSDVLLRDTTFTVGAFTYAVCGPMQVQLVKIEGEGEILIPERVSFGGEEYEVVSIGKIVDGIFRIDSIADPYTEITRIIVPKTVKYIFSGAFNLAYLEYIDVADGNAYYIDIDGILYLADDRSEPEWRPNNYQN